MAASLRPSTGTYFNKFLGVRVTRVMVMMVVMVLRGKRRACKHRQN
jgi:hypothetical protein